MTHVTVAVCTFEIKHVPVGDGRIVENGRIVVHSAPESCKDVILKQEAFIYRPSGHSRLHLVPVAPLLHT